MKLLFRILSFLSVTLFLLSAHAEEKPHLKIDLLSDQKTIQPGQTLKLGVHFKIEHGWHIYWLNPGDAGLAPSVHWKLPPGFKVGNILWPIPQRIALPSVTDYGYENDVLLTVPVRVPKNIKPNKIFTLSAKVDWLVCKETCIPGSSLVTLALQTSEAKPVSSAQTTLFTKNEKNLPAVLPKGWKVTGTLNPKEFDLVVRAPADISDMVFFPITPNQIDNATPQIFHRSDQSVQLTLQRAEGLLTNVKTLEGLLVMSANGTKKGYWVKVPIFLK